MASTGESSSPPTLRGQMTIEAHDGGDGVLVPKVIFSSIGRISPGWFERHINYILRQIMHAQVAERTGIRRRLYNENGARQ